MYISLSKQRDFGQKKLVRNDWWLTVMANCPEIQVWYIYYYTQAIPRNRSGTFLIPSTIYKLTAKSLYQNFEHFIIGTNNVLFLSPITVGYTFYIMVKVG